MSGKMFSAVLYQKHVILGKKELNGKKSPTYF
jgi:hypothetical protein